MNLTDALKQAVDRDCFVDVSEGAAIRKGYPSMIFDGVIQNMQKLGYKCFVIKVGNREKYKVLAAPRAKFSDITIELKAKGEK